MENNWQKLKDKLNEQISEINEHSGSSGSSNASKRSYYEVLKMMDYIEQGKQNELIPHNCLWKTQEEIAKEVIDYLQWERGCFNTNEEFLAWVRQYFKDHCEYILQTTIESAIEKYCDEHNIK
jgi:hypothetical protein